MVSWDLKTIGLGVCVFVLLIESSYVLTRGSLPRGTFSETGKEQTNVHPQTECPEQKVVVKCENGGKSPQPQPEKPCPDNPSKKGNGEIIPKPVDTEIWWAKNNDKYSDERYIERGWFPEKEVDKKEMEANYTEGQENAPFFQKCLDKVYKNTWPKDPKRVIEDLKKWILLEPVHDFDRNCLPPPLQNPSKMQCKTDYPHAGFRNSPRSSPKKAAVCFQYGLETDVLEIFLMEVYDVVDKIFIAESVRTHRDLKAKPLMWEELKWTPRFRKFQDKVVHIILDDVAFSPDAGKDDIFKIERKQEEIRFRRVVEWNDKNNYFSDDDIISFGDADEIPSRNAIHAMKWCDMENDDNGIDVGSMFLNKYVKGQFKSDYPVRGEPHTLGDPTFYTFGRCKRVNKEGQWLGRNRGTSGKHILGGVHLTYYPYVPQLMTKGLSCTECDGHIGLISEIFFSGKSKYWNALKSYMDDYSRFESRTHDLRGKLNPGVEFYPWALRCNPLRYKPSALGVPDDRLFLTEDKVPFDTC